LLLPDAYCIECYTACKVASRELYVEQAPNALSYILCLKPIPAPTFAL